MNWHLTSQGDTEPGMRKPFRVVDASDGFLNIRNGPGPTYQEVAKMPLGATGLVGRCVPLDGGWKPFCEVEWQGVRGWASSCCIADWEPSTPPRLQPSQTTNRAN
jgi:uncharacterized protein YraI